MNQAILGDSSPGSIPNATDQQAVPGRRSLPLVALVGNPNVGKSVMFGALTGHYATVSNYPGTTVELTVASAELGGRHCRVVDTPGMYSVVPITEEERVARGVVMEQRPFAVVHVVDAKSLQRTLPLTVQLAELGQSVVLVLNMMDEAKRLGIRLDIDGLRRELAIPVIGATMTQREGLAEAKAAISGVREMARSKTPLLRYSAHIERAVGEISPRLPARFAGAERGIALLLLQEDAWARSEVARADPEAAEAIDNVVQRTRAMSPQPLFYQIALERQTACTALVGRHAEFPTRARSGLGRRLSELTIAPVTGLPIQLHGLVAARRAPHGHRRAERAPAGRAHSRGRGRRVPAEPDFDRRGGHPQAAGSRCHAGRVDQGRPEHAFLGLRARIHRVRDRYGTRSFDHGARVTRFGERFATDDGNRILTQATPERDQGHS
jgi:small GTP-binding protein